jgi:hypothetical protein
MADTLTWHISAAGTKTNTTVASFFTDFNTLITSYAGNANYLWQVASVNDAGTPYYLVLKRKDASAGRILVVCWTSAPAGNNAAILAQAPGTNYIYVAWFPAGSADTPSNLAAASGTILGDDTGAVKVASFGVHSTIYTTNLAPAYADSQAGVIFLTGHTGTANAYMAGAGDLVVDTVDTAYGCTFGVNSATIANFSATSSPNFPWTATAIPAGSATPHIRTNYGTTDSCYFIAYLPTGSWAATPVGSTDVLSNTAVNKVWFVPVYLMNQVKGNGMPLKFRQMGYGPATTGAFASYNATGPVTAAIQLCMYASGGNSNPWITNFEI